MLEYIHPLLPVALVILSLGVSTAINWRRRPR